MKKATLLLVSAVCLTIVGCGRIHGPVDEVNALAEEKEAVLTQIGEKLETTPTEAGVDEARAVFDAHKDSLKAKREAIDKAPEGFNKDWQSLLWKTEARHKEMLEAIGIKFIVACRSDECEEKWRALEKDFQDAVKRQ